MTVGAIDTTETEQENGRKNETTILEEYVDWWHG